VRPRLRVGIVTDNDFEKVNGVTTTLTAVLSHAPADLALRVYTASRLGEELPEYLALASFGVRIPFYPGMRMYWPRYRRLVARLERDGVHVLHLTTPGPLGLAAIAAARHLGVPLVGSFHTDLAAYTTLLSGRPALGAFMRGYMRWLYGHCQHVLVPSEATRTLLADAGTDPNRVGLWGRGVDVATFTPSRRNAALRGQWGADASHPVLLYVGRVSAEKGVGRLPALHDELVSHGIPHRLVVVGDGPLRAEIARRCPAARCLGTLGRERLADVYASADVFVFPSTTDTAGNVVLEAQASGLPVLVSSRGGPRELMEPGTSGLVCGEPLDEWVRAAGWLATDAITRERMGAEARRVACGRSWTSALEPLFDAYRTAGRAPAGAVPSAVAPPRVA
jgi:glycosyltransferase involved in cell wall biosynthesis